MYFKIRPLVVFLDFQFFSFSKKWSALGLLFILNTMILSAQVTLNADGTGNTYELINSKLAPSGNVIESPDQNPDGSHVSFGRHIAEVWDADLNKCVFEFYSHLDTGTTGVLDNDVSTSKTDRQRIEIKTYASSPSNLKGTLGETVTYKWCFKVPLGFQPSSNFTHIHQIKAVGGDESNPIFTLTPRKGSPNKLELIYVKDMNSGTDKKVIVDLSLFEGIWVEATETIKFGDSGTYEILIQRVDNGATVLAYRNCNIATIRPDNTFIRPKWGIYRSIVDIGSLRDEAVRFSDFSITEGSLSTEDFLLSKKESILIPNPIYDNLMLSESILSNYDWIKIYNTNGQLIVSSKITSIQFDVSNLKSGFYIVAFLKNNTETKSFKFIKK
jgi:hypothetical protein